MAGRDKDEAAGRADRWLVGLIGYYALVGIASLSNVAATRWEMAIAYLLPLPVALAIGALSHGRHPA